MEQLERERFVAEVAVHLRDGVVPMADATMENPVAAYTDAAHTRRERALVFDTQPMVLAVSAQVPNAGDFVTDELTGEPLVVVRGEDLVVRAFYNVCRHRGTKVVCESGGSQRRFACPFHGWTYDTTGTLRAVPESYAFPDLDEARNHLTQLPVVERHGLIWRLPPGWAEADLIESLGPLDAELASYGAETYVLERSEQIEQPFNWKFAIDGFLETYHFRFLHSKTIAPFIRGNYGPTTTYGHNIRMMALRSSYIPEVAEASEFVDPMPHVAAVYILFPNTVFVWQGDHLEVWRMYPDGDDPGRSIMTASLLAPKATETDDEQRHWDRNWAVLMGTVLNEDFAVSRAAQAGFGSRAQTHVLYGRNEPALQAFHRSLASLCGSEVR
jgi:phenylpropionate dioxygenase-like ring-hydroxylating dioxygenase large terminal subunit